MRIFWASCSRCYNSRKPVSLKTDFSQSNAAIGWLAPSSWRGNTENSSTTSQLLYFKTWAAGLSTAAFTNLNRPDIFTATTYNFRSLKLYLQHVPIFLFCFSKHLHPWCTNFMIWIKSTCLLFHEMKTKDDLSILNIVFWHYRNQNQSWLLVYTRNEKRKSSLKRYITGQFLRLAEAKGMLKYESNCPTRLQSRFWYTWSLGKLVSILVI